MIYTNETLHASEVKLEFGTIYQIQQGQRGRGRKLVALTCSESCTLEQGLNRSYSIGLTKSGKPRVIEQADNKVFLLLHSNGGYTRRHDGSILIDKNAVEILAVGNGADGDAGRIGSWQVALLEAKEDTVILIDYSGHYGKENEYICVHRGAVYAVPVSQFDDFCEHMGAEITLPNFEKVGE